MRVLVICIALGLSLAACSRSTREPASAPAEPAAGDAAAMAADRPERLVMPLAPAGSGHVVVERVSVRRVEPVAPVAPMSAPLEVAPPAAEPGEPPATEPVASAPDTASLKPPIARGLPNLVSGGRGGRVTLDVRVDESGDVSEVMLVETDADSATVAAATRAAYEVRYLPAMLGGRRVAVWCRQVFNVKDAKRRR